jgi:hypothetical protein
MTDCHYTEINGVRWMSVKCFADNHPETRTANFAMRLTKSGRVNLHDVNKWLRGSAYKVPLRFYEGGVRRLNPDVEWPEDVLRHDTPEVYAGQGEDFVALLTEEFLRVTPHEWEE